MQTSTLVLLACLVAAAVMMVAAEEQPLQQQYEAVYDAPEQERGDRTKRGLLLLKKKLLLGALGLKAAKVGAVGAGVAAVALKKKSQQRHGSTRYIDIHSRPSKYVEVHSWSG
ncbi:uncharacterized protein LOC121730150 isoform X1 [Aricia agestis]|uniref:uncharacterized protein LOC121730150 isoform X1 n=1 Tax=Aricia agestis TaxID=91739 RepID=UPI001C2042A5|nr:uncharacterized protein LOC121730150 isoform X1 [Aricia agestis]